MRPAHALIALSILVSIMLLSSAATETYLGSKSNALVFQGTNTQCPSGYYYNTSTSACQQYPSTTTSCPSGYYYNASKSSCQQYPSGTTSCQTGYYYNTSTNSCQKYPSTTTSCPIGYYYNTSTNSCQQSNITSATCSAPTWSLPQGCIWVSANNANGSCTGHISCQQNSQQTSCLPGYYYNTSRQVCQKYYFGNYTTVNVIIVPTISANQISLGYRNIINETSFNSIPTNLLLNISAKLGIPLFVLANSIPNTANKSSFRFGCLSCNSTAINNSIQAFTNNISLVRTAFVNAAIANNSISSNPNNIAQFVIKNTTAFKQFVNNYTPTGFTVVNSSVVRVFSNTLQGKAMWAAYGNVAKADVNTSILNLIQSQNQNSQSLAQKEATPFIKSLLNDAKLVNETQYQEMFVSQVINGNKTMSTYIPTNLTVYKTKRAAVVSFTNLVSGINDNVSIPKTNIPITNISFSTKRNFTASVIGIKSYVANNTILTLYGKTLASPNAFPIYYISINSSIKDSDINAVNYIFNVTKAYLIKNKINASTIYLFKYNATTSSWTRLPTVIINSNATNYFFKAKSPGMSIYMMAEFSPNNTVSISSNSSGVTVTQHKTSNSSSNKTAANNAAKQPLLSTTNAIIIVIIVVILIVIAIILLRRRQY